MTLDDAEIGQQVICTRICPLTNPSLSNITPSALLSREVGHIGYITGIVPIHSAVYVSHLELREEGAYEHLTLFLLEELEPFDSPQTPYLNKLRSAIEKNLVKLTRE